MRGGGEARLLGKWGETQVANYLRQRGYEVLDMNYRCRMGELDLVASKGRYLAFVEVKLRRNGDLMAAREAVTYSKQQKLRSAALLYLQAHPTKLQPRFDVAEIYAPQGTGTRHPHINYLENAF
ncbi:YraN family protein [Pseudoflavonifractor sp. An85]|uniref:YraN family protein n=1 Tax=Pseudoflavonifractor sp. An85 TaxID=1965661 RepID=UPI000B3AE507|nr:YraN family protein [Pseudoflavonifractor sp. An85]OUN25034.1 YraN family protein [Pseudoflavonifractor sp. An85]